MNERLMKALAEVGFELKFLNDFRAHDIHAVEDEIDYVDITVKGKHLDEDITIVFTYKDGKLEWSHTV